ncbi:hypothetical protein CFB84_40275 [Burkholderia aenigmatica]|uniref:Uncharacterized protein n=1 Tax=Burkholderia aenigmatica TaxID=2015348 RepID=A0A228HRQ6_9BURK|nr:hypothetical protein CFB84_40275 [Burkholderia aenigmatica]
MRGQRIRSRHAEIAAAGLSKQDYPLPARRQQSTICCASRKKNLCDRRSAERRYRERGALDGLPRTPERRYTRCHAGRHGSDTRGTLRYARYGSGRSRRTGAPAPATRRLERVSPATGRGTPAAPR